MNPHCYVLNRIRTLPSLLCIDCSRDEKRQTVFEQEVVVNLTIPPVTSPPSSTRYLPAPTKKESSPNKKGSQRNPLIEITPRPAHLFRLRNFIVITWNLWERDGRGLLAVGCRSTVSIRYPFGMPELCLGPPTCH